MLIVHSHFLVFFSQRYNHLKKYAMPAIFTITSLGRTPAEALSAILRPEGRFRHLSLSITLKNTPDDFCAAAWLCTHMLGWDFSG